MRSFLWRTGNEMLRRLTVLPKKNGGPARNRTSAMKIPSTRITGFTDV